MPSSNHYDVLIIGAGLSGVGAAYYMKQANLTFKVLEKRKDLGGTWDFFKYPGFRNDSSMFTFAFAFHPWTKERHILEGKHICQYLNEVVDKYSLRSAITFNCGVDNASFNSSTSSSLRWVCT